MSDKIALRFDFVAVGGCHCDIISRSGEFFQIGTSCPGRTHESTGGVSRNVIQLLASAGFETALVSRVGNDAAGQSLIKSLGGQGVFAAFLPPEPGFSTGRYVAIHDHNGELVAAIADLAIYDTLTPEALAPLLAVFETAKFIFADANLPEAAIAWLADRFQNKLAVDAISKAKASRVMPALLKGALIFLNLPSTQALTGQPVAAPLEAARALAGIGAKSAVITGGAMPVALLADGKIEALPVPPAEIRDVTGAGDALCAGTLIGLASGIKLRDAVAIGMMAAQEALQSVGALDQMPRAVMEAVAVTKTSGVSL